MMMPVAGIDDCLGDVCVAAVPSCWIDRSCLSLAQLYFETEGVRLKYKLSHVLALESGDPFMLPNCPIIYLFKRI
jgi:hypothetical protein